MKHQAQSSGGTMHPVTADMGCWPPGEGLVTREANRWKGVQEGAANRFSLFLFVKIMDNSVLF